jgi:hypothetical protein
MEAPLGIAVDMLLQHARELAGLGDQGRELVQGQSRPRGGFTPEAGEEGVPVRVGHPVEPGEEAGDLRRKARPLEAPLTLVSHIVNGPLRRQDFAQEPRLATSPAAIQHAQGALPALHQARKARCLFIAVEEGKLHRNYAPGTLCRRCIVLSSILLCR